MSEDEIIAFLSTGDTGRIFLCRFTDGTEVEITDPWVRDLTDGQRECVATVVRETAGIDVAAGGALSFALGEIADVRYSPRGFERFR